MCKRVARIGWLAVWFCGLAGAQTSAPTAAASLPATPPATTTAAAPAAPASQPAVAGVFEPSGFLVRTAPWGPDQRPMRYCVFVPPEYDPTKAWPVIIFLHGSGERGSDGLLQTEVGLGRTIRRNAVSFPAIVIMPQCPEGRGWEGDLLNFAIRCLQEVDLQYSLDSERLYVTGLSMGGFGAWYLGAILKNNVAAVAPICGFVSNPRLTPDATMQQPLVEALKDVPLWVVHGAQDKAVPVEHSRAMVDALKLAGATELHYTEVSNGEHNVWDQAYEDPKFWSWLLSQRRTAPRPATSQPAVPLPAVRQAPASQPGAAP